MIRKRVLDHSNVGGEGKVGNRRCVLHDVKRDAGCAKQVDRGSQADGICVCQKKGSFEQCYLKRLARKLNVGSE